jgi:hypothetical protein
MLSEQQGDSAADRFVCAQHVSATRARWRRLQAAVVLTGGQGL